MRIQIEPTEAVYPDTCQQDQGREVVAGHRCSNCGNCCGSHQSHSHTIQWPKHLSAAYRPSGALSSRQAAAQGHNSMVWSVMVGM